MLRLLLLLALLGSPVLSHSQNCGDPPPVQDVQIKGDLNGKAQFLSRFLGDASLGGKIEETRTEIFSRYKNSSERSDAYFEYQVCVLIMQDKTMTAEQKIDKLTAIRAQFRTAPVTRKTETRDGPNVNFGCGEGSSSPVNYSAPAGFHIVSANASVIDSANTKSASAKVESQTHTSASAVASFQGRDREWTGNCPGGGHGAVRITVESEVD